MTFIYFYLDSYRDSLENATLASVLKSANDELSRVNQSTSIDHVTDLMDKLSDSRIDIESVSSTLATDQTSTEFHDDELEKELDSLLYQNDTENISDMFGTLTVDPKPPSENIEGPGISPEISEISPDPSASLDDSSQKL